MPRPVMDDLLQAVWEVGATDLLLTAGSPPLCRVDGSLRPMEAPPLRPADIDKLAAGLLTDDLAERFRARRDADFSFNWRDRARFRGNVFRQRGSAAIALRLIPFSIPSLDELGVPEPAIRLSELPRGLILVTGPTGSGKSTTIASLIDHINETRASHVLTIEDPIEYLHRHKRSAVNQREIGLDADSFQHALRSALREDPDVLMIGEMRDLETIQATLTFAETGHLVFATLHTNDTAQALDRVVDVFPAERQRQIRVQLANALSGIIHQRLVPKVDGGRVAAFEVLIATFAVRNLILEGKTGQIRNVLSTSQKEGMQTLESALSELVAQGVISYEEALTHSVYPREVVPPGGRPGRR